MQDSLEQLLNRVARRGSWFGGGSAAALTAAVAAALLEKLVVAPKTAQALRRSRRACLKLIRQDAEAFANVIGATRSQNRRRFVQALSAATAVQQEVLRHSRGIQQACRVARRSINRKFQSDLHCAMALASASGASARVLIRTNLAWLRQHTIR